jgi:phenylalanyl-tRNA synthetase alpha chain
VETKRITAQAYATALALRDLTDETQGRHCMQRIVADVIAALQTVWSCQVVLHRSHPLVSIEDNYERLGYADDAAARDARHTRYLDDAHVLRTHTSAMIPALLRKHRAWSHSETLLVCPGLVYRRDSIDRLHVGEPHQLDLWRIAHTPLDKADLQEMVALVLQALLPGAAYRCTATSHPYTEAGIEVEVAIGGEWVEILECGLAAQEVLDTAGLSDRYGLAMGIGLDRVLMLRKGIGDIRLLRSTDERVQTQMLDLQPYRPVSPMPLVRRDLSIAVEQETSAEDLGDRVRSALGSPRTDYVESVEIISETKSEALPKDARDRIGMSPEQKNVLVRVVLRHPTRTLTTEDANVLRDDIYAAIHEGSVHQWATPHD